MNMEDAVVYFQSKVFFDNSKIYERKLLVSILLIDHVVLAKKNYMHVSYTLSNKSVAR